MVMVAAIVAVPAALVSDGGTSKPFRLEPSVWLPSAHSSLTIPDSASATPDHVHPGGASAGAHVRSTRVSAPSSNEVTTGGVRSATNRAGCAVIVLKPARLVAVTMSV